MMLKRREDLVRAVMESDRDLRQAQARLNKKINKFYADYAARVQALVRNPKNVPREEKIQLAVAQRIASDMARVLQDAGMEDLIGEFLDEFPGLTKSALRFVRNYSEEADLAGVSKESLTGFIRFTEGTLRRNVEARLVAPLQEGIFQSVFAGAPRDKIIEDIAAKAENLRPDQVQTLVNDSFAQYQRTVRVEKGDALGLEIYIYTGPDDEITSEQCQHLLGIEEHGLAGALYKNEISANLHPKLTANPLIAGGHPRCRHQYLPIPLDYAKGLGFEP